jgi:hypothetical protein
MNLHPLWGPFNEPAVCMSYGESATGKSTDGLRTHPSALWLSPPGGVKPAVATLGFQPAVQIVNTIEECIQWIPWAMKNGGVERWPAIGIDDGSILARNTAMLMEQSGKYVSRSGFIDGLRIFGDVAKLITQFCYLTRNAGMHASISFHERAPSTDPKSGEYFKGGPDIGSKNQTKHLPHIVDLCARARPGGSGTIWHGSFEIKEGNVDYHQKDRFGVAPASGPLNTGEILRIAGYPLKRLPGLEWMDEIAGRIFEHAIQATNRDQTIQVQTKWATDLLAKGVILPFVRWVLQDGLDRAEIVRRRRQEQLAILTSGRPSGSALGNLGALQAPVSGGPAGASGSETPLHGSPPNTWADPAPSTAALSKELQIATRQPLLRTS